MAWPPVGQVPRTAPPSLLRGPREALFQDGLRGTHSRTGTRPGIRGRLAVLREVQGHCMQDIELAVGLTAAVL